MEENQADEIFYPEWKLQLYLFIFNQPVLLVSNQKSTQLLTTKWAQKHKIRRNSEFQKSSK